MNGTGRRRAVTLLAFTAAVFFAGCAGVGGAAFSQEDATSAGQSTTAVESTSASMESTAASTESTTGASVPTTSQSTDDASSSAEGEEESSGTTSEPTSTTETVEGTATNDGDGASSSGGGASSGGADDGSASGGEDDSVDDSSDSEGDGESSVEGCDRDVTRDDQSVNVLTCQMVRHDDGSVTVSGTWENGGETPLYDPGVYVRPYDADGEMIPEGTYERYGRDLHSGQLDPGESVDYSVTFENASAVDDYEVAGYDDAEAGPYESDRNVYWKAFDDDRREADDVLFQYAHQDSNGLVVYGTAEYVSGLHDITYTVTVETGEETIERQINAGDADEDGEVTFAVYFPDVTTDGYQVRVTGHGYTEPQDG